MDFLMLDTTKRIKGMLKQGEMFNCLQWYRRDGQWRLWYRAHHCLPIKARKRRISQFRMCEQVFTGSRSNPSSLHIQRVNLQTRFFSSQQPMHWIISQARLRTLKEIVIIPSDSNSAEEDVVSRFLGARGTIFLIHYPFLFYFYFTIIMKSK